MGARISLNAAHISICLIFEPISLLMYALTSIPRHKQHIRGRREDGEIICVAHINRFLSRYREIASDIACILMCVS